MASGNDLAEVAALVGDPARANMLLALMDGRARTAKELAFFGRISPSTASGHLARLAQARLIVLERQGRHHYYRLASPLVGRMIEAISLVGTGAPPRHRPLGRADRALRAARVCYDHLAGRLGVAITDALVAKGHVVLAGGAGEVTASGRRLFAEMGLDLAPAGRSRRLFCRPCLDWTERRPHLAGHVGAALCARCLSLGWVERMRDSRALAITPAGQKGFGEAFGLAAGELDAERPIPAAA